MTATLLSCVQDALLIGSRFDSDADGSACRLAFYGRIAMLLDDSNPAALQQLHLFRLKQKQGTIERVAADGHSAVCKGMFKKETDISLFSGMKVSRKHRPAASVLGSMAELHLHLHVLPALVLTDHLRITAFMWVPCSICGAA